MGGINPARSYSSPIFGVQHMITIRVEPNATAASTVAGVVFPTTVMVTRIGGFSNVVGSATNYGYDMFKNTTSIGACTLSSNAYGSNATALTSTLATTDSLVIKNTTSDATAKTVLAIHYVELFDQT
jgi:hypothetical protein